MEAAAFLVLAWHVQIGRLGEALQCQAFETLTLLCAGQKGLAAVARAVDGRGAETSLTTAICELVGVQHSQDLLG